MNLASHGLYRGQGSWQAVKVQRSLFGGKFARCSTYFVRVSIVCVFDSGGLGELGIPRFNRPTHKQIWRLACQ